MKKFKAIAILFSIFVSIALISIFVSGQTPGSVFRAILINQGTLAGINNPAVRVNATWNNAATTFDVLSANITQTALAGDSSFLRFTSGGVDQFKVNWNGSPVIDPNGALMFNGSTQLYPTADGTLFLSNSTATGFTRLIFGSGPGLAASPALAPVTVGGQAQGFQILKGDGTAQTFANLGAAANGTMIYCSDCTIANPCAGAGTGAIAKRLAGAWVCN